MKAIIMAGGKGVRLQPISIGCPKPMIPIFDKPVMEHIIDLLKANGITEAMATLQYMPEKIVRHFEENPPKDFELRFAIEDKPLGTAGSVAACREYIGSEDFIVISGDAVCDMNLSDCIKQHREWEADATLVLCKHNRPLEYGLVMTAEDGRVVRFIEKPTWGQVFCDTVNTGIYILKPEVLDRVTPDRSVDFAKDVFKEMLEDGAKLYGFTAPGYWCDVGDPQAYLQSHIDLLSGGTQFHVEGDIPPDHAFVRHPVYIGEHVRIGKGAVIGPYAVLGAGSIIGDEATIEYSICGSACIGEGAKVYGSILGKGVTVGHDAVIGEGCVLGERVQIEPSAYVSPGVKIWPGLKVDGGSGAERDVRRSSSSGQELPFDENGDLVGDYITITADVCMLLGSAIGEEGTVGLGYAGGRAAETLCAAISCGVRHVGGDIIRHDARFVSEAAFAGDIYGAVNSIFVEQHEDGIRVRILPGNQIIQRREMLRKIGNAAKSGIPSEQLMQYGVEKFALGVPLAYERFMSSEITYKSAVLVRSRGIASDVLKKLLGDNLDSYRIGGVPKLSISEDGTELSIIDESDRILNRAAVDTILALIHFWEGNNVIALPFGAPKVIEELAAVEGCTVYRQNRDELYDKHLKQSHFLQDGIWAGIKLCRYLGRNGLSVAELYDMLPKFAVYSMETPFKGDRGALMKRLATDTSERELGDGVRIQKNGGWVHVAPCISKKYIKVVGEGLNAEIAKELCGEVVDMIKRW